MAHISDGVLAAPVLIGGAAMAAVLLAAGLRRLDPERLPQAAVMSAAFFVASLVHVPLGPSSVHLILNGLVGIVLGWAAIPAIFVALLLQAFFFGYGGITTLGVNTVIIALPAVLSFVLFAEGARRGAPMLWGAAAGATAVIATSIGAAAALAVGGASFATAAKLVLIAHLPVIAVEALLTGIIVGFLRRVRPEILSFGRIAARPNEA
ncbi:MAG: cobalt transporter CbiM [Rhodospirillales bacterium]|jgi:cobalt/nickel transport system permease protein|nr:cobalt transporter CbiM [Rhodospirillales bacterium]